VILISALIYYTASGFKGLNPDHFRGLFQKGEVNLLLGTALLTFTYFGANGIIELGGEIVRPGRVIPKAFFIALPIVALVYISVAAATIGAAPAVEIEQAVEPLIYVTNLTGSETGAIFFVFCGAILALTTTLNALFIVGTKSLLIMVEDKLLPRVLGKVHRRFAAPQALLTTIWICSVLGIISGFSLETLASFAALGGLIIFLPIQIASLRLPKLFPEQYYQSEFKLKGFWLWFCPSVGMAMVIFFGTNHGLATAIFAEKLGIGCTLLLFKQPLNRDVKEKLLLFTTYNARMMYCRTKLRAALAFYVTMRIKHPGAYFLYAGGSSPTGTVGFVNAAFELKSQIESGVLPEPAVIFCPAGSNGTLAGLTLGVMLAGLKSKTIGVRVSASHLGPFQIRTPDAVLRLMKSTYRYLRKNGKTIPEAELKTPLMLNDYFGEGYGRPTKAGNEASALANKTDVVLDSTYTAKTFAAVLDYCRVHSSESEPVLYWHTYNSVDMTSKINWSDADKLPPPLQKFM
jgi:D-cysteine desulfhydrase